MKDKFVNPNGMRLTKQLFVEFSHLSDKDYAIYTLDTEDKEVNGKVYPSLYRLYMEEKDITEGRFIKKYLYDREQWERIYASPMLKEHIDRWRADLKLMITSELVAELMEDAKSGSKSSTSSAKYLLDNFGVKPSPRKRGIGRPDNKPNFPEKDYDYEKDLLRVVKNGE